MLFGLKDQKLERYIKILLNESEDYELRFNDLKKITSLRLSNNIFDSERELNTAIEIFAKHGNVNSLTLSGINIGPQEITMLNKITGLKTLVINNAKVKAGNKKLDLPLEKLIVVGCTGKDIASILTDKSAKGLKTLNISDNENLTKEDVTALVEKSENLEELTLDGNKELEDIERPEGVKEFSQESEYRPVDKSWNRDANIESAQNLSIEQLKGLTDDEIGKQLKGRKITVTAEDFKTEEGRALLKKISKTATIDLQLETTADLSMEQLEKLEKSFNIDRVYVNTGWTETKNKGYSYGTYKAIKHEINEIVKDIDPNLSEEEKYLAVRKKLAQSITYDHAALEAKPGTRDYYSSRNLENALLSHTCVCAGYADVAKNVYAEMGIESKYVEGYTKSGEYHAWNLVKINGQWYQDDLTWDRGGRTNYALLDDAQMSETHGSITYVDDGTKIPACNAPRPNAVIAERNGRSSSTSSKNDDYLR